MLRRAALAAATAVLLAMAPVLGVPALAATAGVASTSAPDDAVAAAPKVVIVVGATEGTTPSYRADADSIAAEAIKYTPNVVKVYSPNATWAAVSAAGQGASIFIYLGHGYGFPSPYKPILTPSVHDGMGLNEVANSGDSDKKYYGESVVSAGIRFARNAIVILDHNCYSAGSSESGNPEPTIPVAKQRVDNFASGYLRAGARLVMADSADGNVIAMIRSIFTTHQTIDAAWHGQAWAHHHDIVWTPMRNPAYTADMDPDTTTTGFHRSIVGNLQVTTDDIVAGAAAVRSPTGVSPELWSLDGTTTLSPNFDGNADNLNLVGWFSETVTWTGTITDPAGKVVKTLTGTGDSAALTWTPVTAGVPAAPGDYTLAIHATDAAGNPPLDTSTVIHVVSQPTPLTGVLSFAPAVSYTTSSTLTFGLTFAGPVSGLTASDFTITGTALGCVVGVAGSGAVYTLTLTTCGAGKVVIQLEPGTVSDGTTTGPAGLILAHWTVIDRTVPKVTTPNASFTTGLAVSGSTLPVTLSWTGADSGGSGIKSYSVARSTDGGSFAVVATSVAPGAAAPTWKTTVTSGHTYRFEVRAYDKAGNASAWLAGPTLAPALSQQTSANATWSGTWATVSSTSFSGSSAKETDAAGASVTYTLTGRAVAIVLTHCATCGEVTVTVDGVAVGTLDTNNASSMYRWVTYGQRFSSWGSHTVTLQVVGTAGQPTISVDAFEIIG
jgi:hypothetical protein